MNVVVIGSGPAGVMAAIRSAELGAQTALVTRGAFGGMAANDGPVPVRTLAYAARLMRDARQLERYGVTVSSPRLDYERLLERVRQVVAEVRDHSSLRHEIDRLGVRVHEHAGTARFGDAHTIEAGSGLRLPADRVVLCPGGASRRLGVPGSELAATHSDAWSLREVPRSLLVVGAGMTGLQVATVFHAFGARVQLVQSGPRILAAEDPEVSAAVAETLRAMGIEVREGIGTIGSLEKTAGGVRVHVSKDGVRDALEAALVVTTIGWVAETTGLDLAAAGVETDARGFVQVDDYLQTSAPHVFAAGDVLGRALIVPPALHDGYVAATNAVQGRALRRESSPDPIGSFTDPEYAHVGIREDQAPAGAFVVGRVHFGETTRTLIDGRTTGFCKIIAEHGSGRILGCHVVGERAVDIVQVAAVAMAGGLRVDQLARVPLSYPTYAGILARSAYRAAREIDPTLNVLEHRDSG
ncbi:MAG: NAD(P)/FAD-dependent oxidoreductase [Candidatus Rokuibacteriota bacterium]|nr:MAG: NAD(P)/FAD-dependent oxidoreductase [Candidatus Rokubacteria bacterium]